jgi:hypothetical protein
MPIPPSAAGRWSIPLVVLAAVLGIGCGVSAIGSLYCFAIAREAEAALEEAQQHTQRELQSRSKEEHGAEARAFLFLGGLPDLAQGIENQKKNLASRFVMLVSEKYAYQFLSLALISGFLGLTLFRYARREEERHHFKEMIRSGVRSFPLLLRLPVRAFTAVRAAVARERKQSDAWSVPRHPMDVSQLPKYPGA